MNLHRARGSGFAGPQPITIEAIAAYLLFFPQWDELLFFEIMTAVDSRYLEGLADGRPRAAPEDQEPNKGKRKGKKR